jgi:predicted nucleic acid-binding protein
MLMLDANILIRAVLGARVLHLLTRYGEQTDFFAPDVAFKEAREHLPGILERLKVPVPAAMAILDAVGKLVQPVEADAYANFESAARQRLERRDEEDWPILAAALALRCPIWREDADFFGCGVATWTN